MLHRRDPPPFDSIVCEAWTIIERAFHRLADRLRSRTPRQQREPFPVTVYLGAARAGRCTGSTYLGWIEYLRSTPMASTGIVREVQRRRHERGSPERCLGQILAFIAAEKTGRICRGVELDPLYVDVIVRRFEAVTGPC
jgi:hypothetical protein